MATDYLGDFFRGWNDFGKNLSDTFFQGLSNWSGGTIFPMQQNPLPRTRPSDEDIQNLMNKFEWSGNPLSDVDISNLRNRDDALSYGTYTALNQQFSDYQAKADKKAQLQGLASGLRQTLNSPMMKELKDTISNVLLKPVFSDADIAGIVSQQKEGVAGSTIANSAALNQDLSNRGIFQSGIGAELEAQGRRAGQESMRRIERDVPIQYKGLNRDAIARGTSIGSALQELINQMEGAATNLEAGTPIPTIDPSILYNLQSAVTSASSENDLTNQLLRVGQVDKGTQLLMSILGNASDQSMGLIQTLLGGLLSRRGGGGGGGDSHGGVSILGSGFNW